tara:strand:+ start:44 stop:148 length:105 start_codon:yes stop_codon:yes gene_type:complete
LVLEMVVVKMAEEMLEEEVRLYMAIILQQLLVQQ